MTPPVIKDKKPERIVEGDAVVKLRPISYHGSLRRNDNKGVVLKTREHPTFGFMLLVKHEGRVAPIWWAAIHWKRDQANSSYENLS